MNKNNDFLIGVIVLAIACASLFIDSIPVIWIGGLIWGGWLIIKSINQEEEPKVITSEIEKEIVTCDNCKEKIRVPKNREKYINIKCPHCHDEPFLSLSDKFHRSSKKTKLLWVGGLSMGIILLLVITFKLGS